jgi:hypothetical protein
MACAAAVFLVIRRVPLGRSASWIAELFAVILSALFLGALATALDFGGWNEPDWRAGLFVLFGSAAIAGAVRLVRFAPTEQQ